MALIDGTRIARARKLGFHSVQENAAAGIDTRGLLELIARCNADPLIDGIPVQSPLPLHIDQDQVVVAVSPDKDVDCFHPENLGHLLAGEPRFLPCTPAGVVELVRRSGVSIEGAEVVGVGVGGSPLVGRPLANMLSARAAGRNATVTMLMANTLASARLRLGG